MNEYADLATLAATALMIGLVVFRAPLMSVLYVLGWSIVGLANLSFLFHGPANYAEVEIAVSIGLIFIIIGQWRQHAWPHKERASKAGSTKARRKEDRRQEA